jgi:hypothetical protein
MPSRFANLNSHYQKPFTNKGATMKQVAKCFVIFRQYQWEEKGTFIVDSFDYRKNPNETHIVVSEIDVEFDAPDNFDPRPQMIESLRKQQNEIQADAFMKCQKIDDAIQQLLAIENKA